MAFIKNTGLGQMISSVFDSLFNITTGDKVVDGSVGLTAFAALGYLATQSGSSQKSISQCKTLDEELLKIWPDRIQAAIDAEGKKWEQFNREASTIYNQGGLTVLKLSEAYEKDRKAYVNFCRINGLFKPLLSQFAQEAGKKGKPWMDCKVSEAKQVAQGNCFKSFDALRKAWNRAYEVRLYQGQQYFELAASWISSHILEQPASTVLKSVPQQILDSQLEGTAPVSAIEILSFIRPFDKKAYCAEGCNYVKRPYREMMQQTYPDKNPFPNAPTQQESERLASQVARVVNDAKKTLCLDLTKKSLC